MLFIKLIVVVKMILNIFFYKIIYRTNLRLSSFKTFIDGDIVLGNGGVINFIGSIHARKFAFFNVQGGEVTIGDDVFFNRNFSLNCRGNIIIGDGCMFGDNVKIYDHDHCFSIKGVSRNDFDIASIEIGNNCWIGSNVIILKGVRIGDNCVVGAGSIVTKDIESNVVFLQKRVSKTISID